MVKRAAVRGPSQPARSAIINTLFYESQSNTTNHEKLLKQMRQEYDKIPLDRFFRCFSSCLVQLFKIGEKHATVERALDFAAKFSVSLYSEQVSGDNTSVEDEEEEEMPVFLKNLFDWLFSSHRTRDQSIRFRICQFINKLLHNLGEEASLDDELCDKISTNMLERLQDKVPAVRAQAVNALQRLQDPTSAECPIIKAFLFHLGADPSTAVRRSVLSSIGRTNITLPHILERTRDIKDVVRRQAYSVLTKLSIRSLSIRQRERLLREGLKDRSETVSSYVAGTLLPAWLRNLKGNYMELLHALDVENSTETSILALKSLIKHRPLTEMMDVILEQQTDKLIPLDKLNPNNALFWRCLAQHLHAEGDELSEQLEKIIPELTPFCNYIRSYYITKTPPPAKDADSSWAQIQRQFVVLQLLELAKVFDLADEMGRSNLKKLVYDMLTCPHVKERLVPVLVELLVEVDSNVNSRLQFLAEIVSEVHEPMSEVSVGPSAEDVRKKQVMLAKIKVQINEIIEEQETAVREQNFMRAQTLLTKVEQLREEFQSLSAESETVHQQVRTECNDRATLSKCLAIIYEMMQSPSVTKLTPHLRSLMENFVMHYIEDNDTYVRSLALRAMGVFCLLDLELAKQYMLLFYFQLANNETDDVCIMSLKVIFDIFHLYGLQPFQMEDDEGEKEADKTGKKKLFDATELEEDDDTDTENTQSTTMNGSSNNFITILTSLLDSTSADMRTVAAEGLCKLLLANRIKSPSLVSRLFIMWYNPVTEGDIYLRQMLAAFFTTFATNCPWGPETLEQAFLPTLRTLFDAPITSPLIEVDQDSVVRLLLNLTRSSINPKQTQSNIHNNLAVTLCNEILNQDEPYNVQILVRGLTQLDLVLDDPVTVQAMNTLVQKVLETVKDKCCLRNIQKFQQMLAGAERTLQSVNSINSEVTNRSSVTTNEQQTNGAEETPEMQIDSDGDSDDSVELSTPYPKTGKRVVPETPDNSDSPHSVRSVETTSSDMAQLDGEANVKTPEPARIKRNTKESSKTKQITKPENLRKGDRHSAGTSSSGDEEEQVHKPRNTKSTQAANSVATSQSEMRENRQAPRYPPRNMRRQVASNESDKEDERQTPRNPPKTRQDKPVASEGTPLLNVEHKRNSPRNSQGQKSGNEETNSETPQVEKTEQRQTSKTNPSKSSGAHSPSDTSSDSPKTRSSRRAKSSAIVLLTPLRNTAKRQTLRNPPKNRKGQAAASSDTERTETPRNLQGRTKKLGSDNMGSDSHMSDTEEKRETRKNNTKTRDQVGESSDTGVSNTKENKKTSRNVSKTRKSQAGLSSDTQGSDTEEERETPRNVSRTRRGQAAASSDTPFSDSEEKRKTPRNLQDRPQKSGTPQLERRQRRQPPRTEPPRATRSGRKSAALQTDSDTSVRTTRSSVTPQETRKRKSWHLS